MTQWRFGQDGRGYLYGNANSRWGYLEADTPEEAWMACRRAWFEERGADASHMVELCEVREGPAVTLVSPPLTWSMADRSPAPKLFIRRAVGLAVDPWPGCVGGLILSVCLKSHNGWQVREWDWDLEHPDYMPTPKEIEEALGRQAFPLSAVAELMPPNPMIWVRNSVLQWFLAPHDFWVARLEQSN